MTGEQLPQPDIFGLPAFMQLSPENFAETLAHSISSFNSSLISNIVGNITYIMTKPIAEYVAYSLTLLIPLPLQLMSQQMR